MFPWSKANVSEPLVPSRYNPSEKLLVNSKLMPTWGVASVLYVPVVVSMNFTTTDELPIAPKITGMNTLKVPLAKYGVIAMLIPLQKP